MTSKEIQVWNAERLSRMQELREVVAKLYPSAEVKVYNSGASSDEGREYTYVTLYFKGSYVKSFDDPRDVSAFRAFVTSCVDIELNRVLEQELY